MAVFHDVTETKRLADVRRDLVINVSHELRTPVAAIRAAVETLLAGALDQPEPARRFSGTIERHCRRLQNLINDLLQLGSLESEHSRQELADTPLAKLVHGAEAGLTELAREAGGDPDRQGSRLAGRGPGRSAPDRAGLDPTGPQRHQAHPGRGPGDHLGRGDQPGKRFWP